MNPPQEIVSSFFLAGHLKRVGAAALRIHLAQYLPNQSVLARRVGSLQNNQKRLLAFDKHPILQCANLTVGFSRERFGVILRLKWPGVLGLDRFKLDLLTRLDAVSFNEVHDFLSVQQPSIGKFDAWPDGTSSI